MSGSSKLEKDFVKICNTIGAQIRGKILLVEASLKKTDFRPKAAKALVEAKELSDKHGIPFISKVAMIGNHAIPLDNNYVPNSYFDKFSDLNPEVVSKLTQVASYALSRQKDDPYGDEDWDESEDNEEDWDESEGSEEEY